MIVDEQRSIYFNYKKNRRTMTNEFKLLIAFLGTRKQRLEHALEEGVKPGAFANLELNCLRAQYVELSGIYEEVIRIYEHSIDKVTEV